MELNKTKMLRVRLSENEYRTLVKLSSGHKCISEYVRVRILGQGVELVDPKEFIRSMDDICTEMKRIGNNINQLAKYVNLRKNMSDEAIASLEQQLSEYIVMEEKLNVTWRKLMRIR